MSEPARKTEKALVIFDFDGTIYKGDSFIDFAMTARGRLKFLIAFIKSIPAIIAWKTGRITNGEAKQRLFSKLYKGLGYEKFRQFGEAFADCIDSRCNADVVGRLDAAQGNAVIATASIGDWIRPWALRHGVGCVIATEAEVAGGALTGKFSTPNCYGAEKVRRLREVFPDMDNCHKVVFTDSATADAQLITIADEYVIIKNG